MQKSAINFYLAFNTLSTAEKRQLLEAVQVVSENELLKRFKMEKIGQALSGARDNVVSIFGLMDINADNPKFLLWLSNHLEFCQLGDSWYYIKELTNALPQIAKTAA